MSKRTTTCPYKVVVRNHGKWGGHSFERTMKQAKRAVNNAKKYHPGFDVSIEANPDYCPKTLTHWVDPIL